MAPSFLQLTDSRSSCRGRRMPLAASCSRSSSIATIQPSSEHRDRSSSSHPPARPSASSSPRLCSIPSRSGEISLLPGARGTGRHFVLGSPWDVEGIGLNESLKSRKPGSTWSSASLAFSRGTLPRGARMGVNFQPAMIHRVIHGETSARIGNCWQMVEKGV